MRSRYEPLRRAAFVLTGEVHTADDLVQTALLKAMRHWSKVQQAQDLDAYLYTVLIRTHRTGLRRRWRAERPAAELPDRALEPSSAVLDRLDLRAALAGLSQAHREVLVLRFMADWSVAECARVLGCPVGTVKSRTPAPRMTRRSCDGLACRP
ncbi:MAG: SigE family RNA polymerase sigma factor [Mycobacteriales bacterium]